MPIEQFIRGSDNQIKLTLTEDGEAVAGAWTELDICIGPVQIHRDADGNGISLSDVTGLLTITPADLAVDEIAALRALSARQSYPVKIIVKSVLNDDGAVFGAGSDRIIFTISDRP